MTRKPPQSLDAPPAPVLADRLRSELEDSAVPGRAEGEKAYLKSELEHLGVPLPAMRTLVRNFVRRHPGLDRETLLELTEELWAPPVHESRSCAALLLENRADLLVREDVAYLEQLLRECGTWAHVDLIAPKGAGALLLRLPETGEDFLRWSRDDHQWVRRGGILSYLLALRDRGEFPHYFQDFGELADPLLTDTRFFVRKALGWALREGAKHHPEEVAGWLRERLPRVSGLTLREAIRPIDDETCRALLADHAVYTGRRPRA
ncbi:DNA alkylation repair protein [Kitasatospora sp. CM 4170]|uniref:DNA alkylation repair protein n=1 Tax=Kitasatospora aburaviensis TaxID=67265 RepID=A0ABW1EQN7_9ACTN|nr:DNA alkylation repair protein [Kitasatospora sp. CM 4170]WNM44484.1 DNA alkylation repair protein [Kitasatospora sp. CM 4170]